MRPWFSGRGDAAQSMWVQAMGVAGGVVRKESGMGTSLWVYVTWTGALLWVLEEALMAKEDFWAEEKLSLEARLENMVMMAVALVMMVMVLTCNGFVSE